MNNPIHNGHRRVELSLSGNRALTQRVVWCVLRSITDSGAFLQVEPSHHTTVLPDVEGKDISLILPSRTYRGKVHRYIDNGMKKYLALKFWN